MEISKYKKVRELIFRSEMARKRKLLPIWNELGLIAGQPRVLSQLLNNDRLSQKELADACWIEPATLSRALDKLEVMGYIIRKDNPQCRRSFLISLTESGRKAAREVESVFETLEQEMFLGFSQHEMGELADMMKHIYENLQ